MRHPSVCRVQLLEKAGDGGVKVKIERRKLADDDSDDNDDDLY